MTVRLSPTIQNLYAQVLDLLLASPEALAPGASKGALKVRRLKSREYAYWQYRDLEGAVRHRYIGAMADPEVEARIDAMRAAQQSAADIRETLRPLARAWAAGGGMTPAREAFRILERLASEGLFAQGAVLVGTPAFLAIGNMRGVNWGQQQVLTQDIDIGASNDIMLALPGDPPVDIPAVMKSLSANFLEVPALSAKHPSTAWKLRGTELRVDFLAPGPRAGAPGKLIGRWKQAADPLWNLGYLVDHETTDAALIGSNSAVLVRLPDAARFAIHKLFVAEQRAAAFTAKKRKDILQANALIALLRDDGDEDLLQSALRAAATCPGMIQKIVRSVGRLATEKGWMTEQIARLDDKHDPSRGPAQP